MTVLPNIFKTGCTKWKCKSVSDTEILPTVLAGTAYNLVGLKLSRAYFVLQKSYTRNSLSSGHFYVTNDAKQLTVFCKQ